jgi:hypothetical protein
MPCISRDRNNACPVCAVEEELVSLLTDPSDQAHFQELASHFPPLATFISSIDLIGWLHSRPATHEYAPMMDDILRALLAARVSASHEQISQSLLTLIFIPSIHKTYNDVRVHYEMLSCEDTAQQVLANFLDIINSRKLRSKKGHISIALARAVRKSAFRWAVKEAMNSARFESIDDLSPDAAAVASKDNFEPAVVLEQLLKHCRTAGTLSASECALLTKTKLEGFEAKEIANTDGEMSSIAVHHRLQGIMAQLRDTATLVPDDNRACAKRIIRKLPPEQSVAAPTSVGVGRERSKIIQNNAVNFFLVNFRPLLPISTK